MMADFPQTKTPKTKGLHVVRRGSFWAMEIKYFNGNKEHHQHEKHRSEVIIYL